MTFIPPKGPSEVGQTEPLHISETVVVSDGAIEQAIHTMKAGLLDAVEPPDYGDEPVFTG